MDAVGPYGQDDRHGLRLVAELRRAGLSETDTVTVMRVLFDRPDLLPGDVKDAVLAVERLTWLRVWRWAPAVWREVRAIRTGRSPG